MPNLKIGEVQTNKHTLCILYIDSRLQIKIKNQKLPPERINNSYMKILQVRVRTTPHDAPGVHKARYLVKKTHRKILAILSQTEQYWL